AVNTRRLREDQHVEAQRQFDQERLFQDQQLALEFLAEMDSAIRQKVRVGDYQFLAVELSTIRGGLAGEPVDPFDLTVNLEVQELIREVARSFPGKFSGNTQLYSSLLAHVQRTAGGDWLPGVTMTNPVLAHLRDDYPELYHAVQQAADDVFGRDAFTGNALGYLVLYFASVLDHTHTEVPAAVLLITSDGPGTGSLIAGKLRVQVPEIREIKIIQVSDLPNQNLAHYGLILATMPLPGFKHQYLVITPILARDEISEIRRLLQQVKPKEATQQRQPSLDQTVTAFESLKTMVLAADDMLQHFAVTEITEAVTTSGATIDAMLAHLPDVVAEAPVVKDALLKRLELAPVGIPDTGLAMIHTSSQGVTVPYIGAFDLKTPLSLPAMDMGTIMLHRVLLLLTPNPVAQETLTLLSAVSAKLIASTTNLQLFEKGHYSQLYQIITEVFMNEIKKIDRR
ncbi:MAG: PTS sugar transporter subunit IIA, partial [Lacticaseibacillus paracasei]|nr:PTS sugar transporter subunit IIA [Lacticaseibacillus paracasei]